MGTEAMDLVYLMVGTVVIIGFYSVVYYVYEQILHNILQNERTTNRLGKVNLDTKGKVGLGVISGLANVFKLDDTLVQFIVLIVTIITGVGPLIFGFVYLTLYTLIKRSNHKLNETNQTASSLVGGEVEVTHNGQTPDIVSAVEDPTESDTYVDTVVGQVNEELSKITGTKIDTSKSNLEVADTMDEDVDEYYNKALKQDESELGESISKK